MNLKTCDGLVLESFRNWDLRILGFGASRFKAAGRAFKPWSLEMRIFVCAGVVFRV